MIKTYSYDITDEIINEVVEQLNRLEYEGKLTVELVKSNNELFDYIFRQEVINDIMNGEVFECWKSDGFSKIGEMIGD